MTYEQIIYEVEDPVATITLNRPEAFNAWTDRMAGEVRNALARAAADPAVVGIVLSGAGKGFCAGADMEEVAALSSGQTDPEGASTAGSSEPMPGEAGWGEDLRGPYTYFLSIPKPVVAALNGSAAGIGLVLALACDARFMAEGGVLTTAFAQRGLVAEFGSGWLLSHLVGPARAIDLLFSGRRVSAREAEALGLVNEAVPSGQALDAARGYIQELAQRSSPSAIAAMKRQVYQFHHEGLARAQADADATMLDSLGWPDLPEGVQSFLEKRPPQFRRLGQR